MAKIDDIRSNTQRNLTRVRNLTKIYKDHLAGTGSGRRATDKADVLRAAVVFLHASLEDFLRDIARWKLPLAAADALSEIPIAGSEGKAIKFTLGNLARFRGQSVDSVIDSSVLEHLRQETYNNVSDIKDLMRGIGQDQTKVDAYAASLGSMMDRRHNIVHRADKNPNTGVGHYTAASLSLGQVDQWIVSVERFVEQTLKDLQCAT